MGDALGAVLLFLVLVTFGVSVVFMLRRPPIEEQPDDDYSSSRSHLNKTDTSR